MISCKSFLICKGGDGWREGGREEGRDGRDGKEKQLCQVDRRNKGLL